LFGGKESVMTTRASRLGGSKQRRRIAIVGIVALALVALSLVAASCGGGTSGGSETTTTAPSTGGGGAEVVMKDMTFDPATVTIKTGKSVTWTNEDSVTHTVAGDNGEFQSGDLANGVTFSFTFDTSGTYTYHCSIHPSMKGTVVAE
jgi:plastocyanin